MIFSTKSVPVKKVAEIYGKNPEWVRQGIVSGYLPIGFATRKGHMVKDVSEINCKKGRIYYYISPKRLYEQTGYLWEDKK